MRALKKLFLTAVFVLFLSTTVNAYDFEVPLVIDGTDCETAYKSDPKYYGFASNNRTYVPLRFISETLDFDVIYDQFSKNITITGNGQEVDMNVYSKDFQVNGVKKAMDVAPIVYKNRTYIPIRYVAESLNKPVSWNPKDNAVYIGHGFNINNINYANFKKLDFSNFGFELYVNPNFEKTLLIEKSSEGGLVNFYDKTLYKKGTMNGLVGSIGTEDEKAFFPAINIYHEKGKVLVRYEFSDKSLKKFDPTLRGSDKALKVFQNSVAVPTKNNFPSFDVNTLNNPSMAVQSEKPKEKPVTKPSNVEYEVFTFGNPKVTMKIPKELMKELVVKRISDSVGQGMGIYDKKTLQDGNPALGGQIKFYEQIIQKKGEYVMYDGMYKLIHSKGEIKTVEGIARDAQVDYRVKEKARAYDDLCKRVDEQVIVTVEN